MIKNLDFLESEIPEHLLIEADDLLDKKDVIVRKSQERNLHLFTVIGEEVEILTTPKYVKKYTCDCSYFSERGICSHITACLMLLRRKRIEKKLKRDAKAGQKAAPKKLTVDAIVDHIDTSILISFVKEYARKNAKFDTALKVNFARRVPVQDLGYKYKSIFDRILKPLSGADEQYTTPSINYFVKHSLELFEQYKDAISLESYVEASTILTMLIRKCSYAMLHAKTAPSSLQDLYSNLHNQVSSLLKSEIAPELRESLVEKLLEILSLSYYLFPQIQNNLAQYLIDLKDKSLSKDIHKILLARLDSASDIDVYADISALAIKNANIINTDYSNIFDGLKAHHLQRLLVNLLKFQQYDLVYKVIDKLEQIPRLKNYSFRETKIILAKADKNVSMLIPLLTEKYLATHSKKILIDLLEFNVEDSGEHLRKIRRSIENNLRFTNQTLDIFAKLEDFDMMVDYALKHDLYSSMTSYMNLIFYHSPPLIDMYVRKYKKQCEEDTLYAHRNQIYILRNIDEIEDPDFSNLHLNDLRAFKKELESLEVE